MSIGWFLGRQIAISFFYVLTFRVTMLVWFSLFSDRQYDGLYESEQRDSYLLSSVASGGAADPTVRTVSNQDQPLTYEYMVFLLSNEGKCACSNI